MGNKVYIGKTFFHYKVLKYDEDKSLKTGRPYYICECLNCHELFSTREDKLDNYDLLVCCKKCSNKLRKTLYPKNNTEIGKIYNDFLVKENLGYIYKPKTHENYWLVECIHCHQNFKKNNAHLRANQTKCVCQNNSKGEKTIADLLNNNNILYIPQYIFPLLPNRIFDFAIINSKGEVIYCIEFDGFQHFQETSMCHDNLKQRRKRDEDKNSFCKNNNIPLIRIPYTDINTLVIKDLTLDSKYKI